MSTIQPTWPVCTTSVCWHTCCWHFCSCSSHKTIPPLKELVVTLLLVQGCCVTALSTGITQPLMMITWVGWKRLNINFKKCWRIKSKHTSLTSFRESVQKTAESKTNKQTKNCGVHCHTTLNRKLLRNLSFYWHHSGFHNDSKDRLQSDNCNRTEIMKINVSSFSLTSYNPGSLSKRQT